MFFKNLPIELLGEYHIISFWYALVYGKFRCYSTFGGSRHRDYSHML